MNDDLVGALRALANKWARRAQDAARESKATAADAEAAAFQRGAAEGYYKAATELAELIKAHPVAPKPVNAAPAAPAENNPAKQAGGRWGGNAASNAPGAAANLAPTASQEASARTTQAVPAPAATPSAAYMAMPLNEVLALMQYAGTVPRDVMPRADNTFLAIFSRWEDLTPSHRQAQLQKADFRLVILEAGQTKDTRDPYLIFAFKA